MGFFVLQFLQEHDLHIWLHDDLFVTFVWIYPLFICSVTWYFSITVEAFGIFQALIFKYFPLNFS